MGVLACLFVFAFMFIAIVVAVVFIVDAGDRKAKKELDAWRAYYNQLLDQLKSDPANPDLFQTTLQAGRHYSNLTRQRRGVTVYDELSLANDLSAATAGARRMPQPTTPAPVSATDRMQQLDALRNAGKLTDAEYGQKRAQILSKHLTDPISRRCLGRSGYGR